MSIFPIKEYLCPRCYQKIPFYRVAFICGNNISGCVNSETTKYFEVSNKSGQVTRKENGMPTAALCPHCTKESYLRVCPKCKKYLPVNIQNTNAFLISIVGAKGSGKSFFVNVLLYSLGRGLISRSGIATRPYDNDSITRMRRITDQINNMIRLEGTDRATSADDNDAILFNFKKNKKEFISSFIDTAGENFNDPVILNSYLPYLANSNAIIFIVDPMQIENIRKQCSKDEIKSASQIIDDKNYTTIDPSKNFTHILGQTLDSIRHQKNLFRKNKLKIPVAVAFSKVDVLKPLFGNNNDITLFRESPSISTGKFDNNDRLAVHSEIQSLLESLGETDFINTLNNNLADYSLFGFSAIGHNNIGLKLNEEVTPLRIADPLLWILHKNGMI